MRRTFLFKCSEEKDKLRRTKALRYIKHGKDQVTDEGVPYHEVPSVKGRRLWYDIGDRVPADMFVQEHWNARFFVPLNEGGFLCDKRLYEIRSRRDRLLPVSLAKLNTNLLVYGSKGPGHAR